MNFYEIEEYESLRILWQDLIMYSFIIIFKHPKCQSKDVRRIKSSVFLQVFNFPPVILDDFFEIFIDERMKDGYHVGSAAVHRYFFIDNFIEDSYYIRVIRNQTSLKISIKYYLN